MGRRYKRREFLADAAVAATVSILLKLCAPGAYASEPRAASTDESDHGAR